MRRIGNAWPQARVRAAAIVVSDPLPEQTPHMALIQRNHEIQTLTADRADQRSQNAFACGARTGVLRTVSPIAAIVRSTPSEKMLSWSWTTYRCD